MFIELYGIQIILLYLLVCTGDHAAAIQFKIFYIFDRDNKRNVCNTDLKIKRISGIVHIFLIQNVNSKYPIRVNNHLTSHFWYAIMILRHNEIFLRRYKVFCNSPILACNFYLYDKNAGSILAY